jgi:hypothetical protein
MPGKRGNPAWVKGVSGNPGGRPEGARVKLGENFLRDALGAWTKHGKAVLEVMAVEEPAKFAQMVAGILPKELNVTTNDLTDSEVAAQLAAFAAESTARALELAAAHAAEKRQGVTH